VCARNKPKVPSKSPLLCYVTDRKAVFRAEGGEVDRSLHLLERKVDAMLSAGIDWVQIREKDLAAKDLSQVVRAALRSAAKDSATTLPPRIFVNDRLDVALAEGAAGVHLGGKSLPVREARDLVREITGAPIPQGCPEPIESTGFVIGVSCHSRAEAEAAASSGADYIFFGPVFATPSKLAFGAPQGLERLAEVSRAIAIPVIAIGGISLENAASCVTAGAAGIAGIRLFQDTADPKSTIARLRTAGD
jgi:thiamine-phosphate pyrophosphorylase